MLIHFKLYIFSFFYRFKWIFLLNKIGNILLEAGKKDEAQRVYEQIFDMSKKRENNRESRRVRAIVKQLADEKILTEALTKNIDKNILNKLATLNFKAVKREDFEKLLKKFDNVDSSLMPEVMEVKSKISRDMRQEKQKEELVNLRSGENNQKTNNMEYTI